MDLNRFMLLPGQERDTIALPETDILIEVYYLGEERFTPTSGELQIYAEIQDEAVAFQTIGYDLQQIDLISMALRWYAELKKYPEMDPRVTPLRMLKH